MCWLGLALSLALLSALLLTLLLVWLGFVPSLVVGLALLFAWLCPWLGLVWLGFFAAASAAAARVSPAWLGLALSLAWLCPWLLDHMSHRPFLDGFAWVEVSRATVTMLICAGLRHV